MNKYTSKKYSLFRDGEFVENFHSQKHAAEIAKLFNDNITPLLETIAAKDARIAELEAQLAELTTPKPVETFEPELLTGKFSDFWRLLIEPHGLVTASNFRYGGGYEQIIFLPEAWEKYEKALEASIGKEITIKATWQDDELEFIFDSIMETESESK